MKLVKKTWAVALTAALTLSAAGGIALAAGADDWYAGGNAALADPFRTTVPLTLYDASGAEVTSGTTTAPLAAYAAAGGVVRSGDDHASLFVHLPQPGTAEGAWSGLQLTGTDAFAGSDAVSAPSALAGRPLVRSGSGSYTLADVVKALPQISSDSSYSGVYELRLRTSSAAKGVSDTYAAAYVKVTGSTWTTTTAPVLGGGGGTTTPTTTTTPTPTQAAGAVATTVTVAWPTFTYGSAATVPVTVTPASGTARPSGSVRLVSGSTVIASGTLSGGAVSLTVAPTALTPGSRTLKVVYPGVTNAFRASESGSTTVTVAKASPAKVTFKVTKAPTSKKKGSGTLSVAVPSGLVAATGSATLAVTKGKKTVTVQATVANGLATFVLPKLKPGVWSLTATYAGDATYAASATKTVKIKVAKAKKKSKA